VDRHLVAAIAHGDRQVVLEPVRPPAGGTAPPLGYGWQVGPVDQTAELLRLGGRKLARVYGLLDGDPRDPPAALELDLQPALTSSVGIVA
jgi:hypothetical protein